MNEHTAWDRVAAEPDRIGFFGKLRSHGDFVSTGLGPTVQSAIDAWLQAGLQRAAQHFGRDFDQVFRAMPSWRFVIGPGLWGPATVAGVLVPSTDRVGRHFPLVIAAQMHRAPVRGGQFDRDDSWFTAAEAIAETSHRRDFDMEGFTAKVRRLRLPHSGRDEPTAPRQAASGGTGSCWWRVGNDRHPPLVLSSPGQPQQQDFLRLLRDGPPAQPAPLQQPAAQPRAVASAGDLGSPLPRRQSPKGVSGQIRLAHADVSHPGTRLTVNSDALVASRQADLFAVIDGVGDGPGSADAARIAATVLEEARRQETIEACVHEIKGKFGRAHSLLQSAATSTGERLASVVALGAVGSRFAVVWTGDCRCYLLRDGMMRSLTRDHVDVGLRRSLARAVGMPGPLSPAVVMDEFHDKDRLLLCSHPLSRILSERTIAEILLSADLDLAAAVLAQEALIANCRDNISALVIDARYHAG